MQVTLPGKTRAAKDGHLGVGEADVPAVRSDATVGYWQPAHLLTLG